MSEPVTAVLFDVDGTLVDTNYLHATTWPPGSRPSTAPVATAIER
jgi:phosphoglycolate phosphatase-like HAD superfamily hydrolase